MRKVVLVLALVVGLTALGGNEVDQDLLRLLDEVRRAEPHERYKVMNELKMRLRELNRHEREQMIRKVYDELRGMKAERHPAVEEKENMTDEKAREKMDEGREEKMEVGIEDKVGGGIEDKVIEKVEDKKEEGEEKEHDHSLDRGRQEGGSMNEGGNDRRDYRVDMD